MHQRAVLTHEISSCEPCYSFNIYASWDAGDRERFVEGLYGLLHGGISTQTFTSVEHRHGISGLPATGALFVGLLRLAVIDDQLADDELHLLRLCPLAWLREDHRTRFERVATVYGPVSVRFRLTDGGTGLTLEVEPAFRHRPARTLVHVPPVPGLRTLAVNGAEHQVMPGDTLAVEL
jgi:hypothetical protein